jgi:hypothetical protein
MGHAITSQLIDLGFKYEGGTDEWVIYAAHGSAYNERVFIVFNTVTGEIEVNREHDEITEKPTLTIKWSAWDESVAYVLERWTA